MWNMSVHAHAVELDARLRARIEQQVRAALEGVVRIGHVRVRLYGDVDGSGLHTCYVRVDRVPAGGLALGETAAGIEGAVARAAARVSAALRRHRADDGAERSAEVLAAFP